MGIPWYFYTLYTKYNTENDLMIDENAVPSMGTDHLFLDYNSMIHPCAQRTLRSSEHSEHIEDAIIKDCLAYTRYIVNVVKPKRLYIMIDGVAPRAKMNQQRERRYKSHFYKTIEQSKPKDSNDSQALRWNSNKITPGTGFMRALQNELRAFKKCIEGDVVEHVYISDADEPGEGEHKMMSYITEKIATSNCGKKICIYGLDADLIMLSLSNVMSDTIVLLRDNTFNDRASETQRTYTYLNIGKLKSCIGKELSTLVDNKSIPSSVLLTDYIFLCFLLGNDFLEHIPSLLIKENATNVLIKQYTRVLNTGEYKSLVDSNAETLQKSIDLRMLRDIFKLLANSEVYFFKNVYSVYKNPDRVIYRDTVDIQKANETDNNVYFYTQDVIRYHEPDYKTRYYKFYGICDIDHACKSYLTGLYWTLGYYTGHKHQNWSWYYKCHATPFVSDLYEYLLRETTTFSEYIDSTKYLRPSANVSSITQLYMVLPRSSLLEILPSVDPELYQRTVRVFNTTSSSLDAFYPNDICLDMIHREYLWQAKIFLKTLDPDFVRVFM